MLNSMHIEMDNEEMTNDELNRLQPSIEHIIVALDDMSNEDRLFTSDSLQSRPLEGKSH